MVNFTNHQDNDDDLINHNEISSHTCNEDKR